MTYLAKVGSFNIDTTKTVGQTQAITGVGFQPTIVLFFWSGSTQTGDTVAGGTYNIGFGAAISSSSRFCVMGISEDAQADSDTLHSQNNTECIRCYTDTAARDGIMDFSSMDADGFTLIVDDQFTQAYRVSYLALGGTDLTNVYIGYYTQPVTTGNFNVTGVGFQPDAIITSSRLSTSTTGQGAGLFHILGMATGSSAQGFVFGGADDNAATSNTLGAGCNAEVTSRGVDHRDTFVSFGADGFTLNHLEGTAANVVFFVAFKGGQYLVGDLTTRTDGNDIAETVGFQPVAVLFASANRTQSTQNTQSDHLALSVGAGTSTSNRACVAVWDEDNLADTETAYANYDSAVYANVKDDAIQGLMDLKSIESTGFTCVMDDTDPAGCWVTYLAIGALEPSSSVSPSHSPSASLSPSASVSPSRSPSASLSPSVSISPSLSPSASISPSLSPSTSLSPSASVSPSFSPSASYSPSASVSPSTPLLAGSVCWGHITGVIEDNIETFADNWVGTGEIVDAGDAEKVCLGVDEYMNSNVVETGARTVELLQNNYDPTGDDVLLRYRHGNSEANCLAAAWNDYAGVFESLGYVQVRLESTL